jgi:hypothetical protein
MNNQYKYLRSRNVQLDEHITEITILQLRHTGESLSSQYHMIKAQLSEIDPYDEPEKYKLINSLARKVRELAESTTECADEFEYQDLQMYLDGYLDRGA